MEFYALLTVKTVSARFKEQLMSTIKELYAYRQMIFSLVKKDLRGRYKGSVLGFWLGSVGLEGLEHAASRSRPQNRARLAFHVSASGAGPYCRYVLGLNRLLSAVAVFCKNCKKTPAFLQLLP